jgi:fructan beta-fructosidase
MSDLMILRPSIHFTPKKNWMNDPNGCVYHKGTYHLFYQYNPFEPTWGTMHWGHATCIDRVSWKEQKPALAPDRLLGEIFSGSAVMDEHDVSGLFSGKSGMLAFYTSHKTAEGNLPGTQHQCLAYSMDEGFSWKKYHQNPIIHNPGIINFRDPKVLYHAESSAWIMLVTSGTAIWIYRSENLIAWEYCSSISPRGLSSSNVLECPDLFPLIDNHGQLHWVLVISLAPTDVSQLLTVMFLIGTFNGYEFSTKTSAQPLDHGGDFYAPQSWNDYPCAPKKQLLIAWANNWAYAHHVPTSPWRGMMTLTRELYIDDEKGQHRLLQKPVLPPEAFERHYPNPDTVTYNPLRIDLSPYKANSIMVTAEKPDSGSLCISFVYNAEEELTIEWNGAFSTIVISRETLLHSQFHQAYPPRLESMIPECKQLLIEIILDISIVEIFINHGQRVFTSQVFPGSPVRDCLCSVKGLIQISEIRHRGYEAIFHD